MSLLEPRQPPGFPREQDYADFRGVLAHAGYSLPGICQALGVRSFDEFRALTPPAVAVRTSQGRPIDALVKLFLTNQPIPSSEFAQAVAPMDPVVWLQAGLVRADGQGTVSNALALLPFEALTICADARFGAGGATHDFVMLPGGTTKSLSPLLLRDRRASALDLGTGSGVLALLAARWCDRVVGTDPNAAAIAFARFNAKINAIENVDFRVGSLFEPVAGETFDQIICNPPFVISPKPGYLYRDAGLQGDAIMEAVIRGSARHLNPAGIAQIVGNWADLAFQSAAERLTSWLAGAGCDALWLQTRAMHPADYAISWITETEVERADERWRVLEEWLAAYQRLGIQRIVHGSLHMKRDASRPNWFGADQVPEVQGGSFGPHVAELLKAQDYLASLGPDAARAILDARLRCSSHARLEQHLQLADSGWRTDAAQVYYAAGFPFARSLGEPQMKFLKSLDGTASARARLREALGDQADRVEPEAASMCLQLVGRAILEIPR